jgi:hypothetical protein
MPLAHPRPGGPAAVEVIKTEEKGSDVNLATYLLLDAFRRDCDTAIVISRYACWRCTFCGGPLGRGVMLAVK